MNDFLRNLLGIRVKRRALPITPAPKLGATILRNGVKIKITQPCDDELWDWLTLVGWRVSPVRNDRRAAVLLPPDTIARLRDAGITRRGEVLDNLVTDATGN